MRPILFALVALAGMTAAAMAETAPPDAAAAFAAGLADSQQGRSQKAIADFTQAIAAKPDYAEAYLRRGALYAFRRDFDRAIADYDSGLALAPSAPLFHARAGAYFGKGDYDRAIADFTAALALNRDMTAAMLGRASAYLRKKDLGHAAEDFSRAELAGSPAGTEGAIYLEALQPDLAIAAYDRAIDWSSRDGAAFAGRAQAHWLKGEADAALADFTKAISLTNGAGQLLVFRGLVYRGKGDEADATADFDKAETLIDSQIAFQPDSAGLKDNACWTRALANRDLDTALADCNAALNGLPGNASLLDSRAMVYFRKGLYALAMADYNAALSGNPNLAGSLFMRGVTKARSGGDGKADIALALAINPSVEARFALYGIKP